MNTPNISPERLAIYIPFSRLADEQRILLSHQLMMHTAFPGEILSRIGDNSQDECFLLTGSVGIEGPDTEEIIVSAGDSRSRYSLLSLKPSHVSVTARTDTEYFTINADLLQSLQSENITGDFNNPELLAGSDSHPVVLEFYKSLMNNRLELPSLPEVSRQISQVIVDEQLDLETIAALISVDAALTARLMRLANSPVYRGRNTVNRLADAINRLGMNTTRHLVLALSLRQQNTSNHPWVKQQLLRSWKQSIQLGAVCFVLARQCTDIPPEEAMLAGLLHNIGELPLLNFAAGYQELRTDPGYLEQVLTEARGQAGAMILHRWNLPVPLVTAVQHTDIWFYEPNDTRPTLADILILARLHCLSASEQHPTLPSIDQVPAFHKISPGALSKQMTLQILDDAREQITEVRNLLNR